MGFSCEDNCCQSHGIGKSIKEKLLKGISELINFAPNTKHNISSVNKGPIRATFSSFHLFSKIMFENWGCGLYTSAAYTRVFTVNTE